MKANYMKHKYIALWHDHNEYKINVLSIHDSPEQAHEALEAKYDEHCGDDGFVEFNGFDVNNNWVYCDDVLNHVTFQISMIN